MDLSVTAIVLTYNEEKHIRRCVENLRRVAERIYVVDSFSTDRTCEMAAECGALVLRHEYVNQAQQFQWALDNCRIESEWTLRMDADEYLSDGLIEEIKSRIPSLPLSSSGCYLPRDVIFLGKRLRFGRIKPVRILRLWRTGSVYMEQRWMDERCILKQGDAVALKGRFIDENLNGLTWWTTKHNHYANREIVVAIGQRYGLFDEDAGLASRNMKKSRYYALPPFLRAFLYFFIRYVVFLGFLDGRPGLIWATLQAYWYRFLIDSKLYEFRRAVGETPTKEQIREYFRREYGIRI